MEMYEVNRLKALLRTGDWEEAQHVISNKINYVIDLLQEKEEKNGKMIKDLNEILIVVQQAIECKDSVLLCDMLEYELAPFLNNINKNEGLK